MGLVGRVAGRAREGANEGEEREGEVKRACEEERKRERGGEQERGVTA